MRSICFRICGVCRECRGIKSRLVGYVVDAPLDFGSLSLTVQLLSTLAFRLLSLTIQLLSSLPHTLCLHPHFHVAGDSTFQGYIVNFCFIISLEVKGCSGQMNTSQARKRSEAIQSLVHRFRGIQAPLKLLIRGQWVASGIHFATHGLGQG